MVMELDLQSEVTSRRGWKMLLITCSHMSSIDFVQDTCTTTSKIGINLYCFEEGLLDCCKSYSFCSIHQSNKKNEEFIKSVHEKLSHMNPKLLTKAHFSTHALANNIENNMRLIVGKEATNEECFG